MSANKEAAFVTGRIELTVAVSRIVKVVIISGKCLECTEACPSFNTSKNVTGAGTLGIGTTGSFTVALSGVSTGKLEHESEASKDSIFDLSESGK